MLASVLQERFGIAAEFVDGGGKSFRPGLFHVHDGVGVVGLGLKDLFESGGGFFVRIHRKRVQTQGLEPDHGVAAADHCNPIHLHHAAFP